MYCCVKAREAGGREGTGVEAVRVFAGVSLKRVALFVPVCCLVVLVSACV